MTSRGARATRGAAIAVFATFVASLAHTVGGGDAPGPVALLLALAFSAPLAMLLTGARSRLVSTSISALVAQAALHLCYAMGSAPAAIATSAGMHPEHTGHAGHGAAAHVDALLAAPLVDHGDAIMPFAHVVAAAITVVALALGDDVLDVVGRTVLLFVRRLTSVLVPVVVAPIRVAASAARPRLVGALLHAALGSRGPPVALAAS